MKKSDLPHDAWIDLENEIVTIPFGGVCLTFSYEQLTEFAERFSDVMTVFLANTSETSELCPTCGVESIHVEYVEPDSEDFH